MVRALLSLVIASVVVPVLGAGPALAQRPIGPHQHFVGLVNGSSSSAVVHVVCGGPVYSGRTGPVAGGQTMSVRQVSAGYGYTGPFGQVYAWFVPQSSSAGAPPMLKFTTYGTPQAIPTSTQVPCGGSGQAEFSSCPYLAPCAYGWVPYYVKVQFVDIAA
jgi:hypothetical protein